MKRSERHHLKENELAHSVTRARETLRRRRREATLGGIAVVVLVAASSGYYVWRERAHARGRDLLADALTTAEARIVPPTPPAPDPASGSPTPATAVPAPTGTYPSERARLEAALSKFLLAANAYPSTPAGIAAQYHAATALAALGKQAEASKQYREVIDRGGGTIYGEMARLGLAEAQAASGQFESAIAAYRTLSSNSKSDLPVDAVLMQLGRVYLVSGKPAEALKTFTRIVDEFPQSPYLTEAKREVDALKAAG